MEPIFKMRISHDLDRIISCFNAAIPKILCSAVAFLSFLILLLFVTSQASDSQLKRIYPSPDFSEIEIKRYVEQQVTSSGDTTYTDWPMFQYNALHTGYNDQSKITVPLELHWSIVDTVHKINEAIRVGNKIVITYGRGPGQSRVACLNADDGSVEWYWLLGTAHEVAQAGYGYGNAYVEVIHGTSSYVVAFDMETGDTLWRTRFRSQNYDYLGPTIHKGKVLFGGGFYGGIYCLNAYTGAVVWHAPGTAADFWTPAAVDDTVYAFLESILSAWNIDTRENYWFFDTKILQSKSSSSNEVSSYWPMGVSPVIDTTQHVAYCIDGPMRRLLAIDLAKQEIIWADTAINHGLGKNPVLYHDFIFATHKGWMQAYNKFTGEKLWTFYGDSALDHAPVAANGYIFVSSLANTYAINISTHEVDWSYPVGGELSVTDKNLYVTDSAYFSLYVFGDIATAIEDDQPAELPTEIVLHQNYPNPFNPSTEISYEIPIRSFVEISIYNTLGQHVKTLIKTKQSAGIHSVTWNGTDTFGKTASSGAYFYKLTAGDFLDSKKMILLK